MSPKSQDYSWRFLYQVLITGVDDPLGIIGLAIVRLGGQVVFPPHSLIDRERRNQLFDENIKVIKT
ncbi:MAG: hypothetical protein ACKOQ2_11195, partial [Dolichospermum sp.]